MKLKNLTPHAVTIIGTAGEVLVTVPPSGEVARVAVENTAAGNLNGLPVFWQVTGAVSGLPEYLEGAVLIVSAMVRLAVPQRLDIASPGELLRGADGQPVGCHGLVLNGGAQ